MNDNSYLKEEDLLDPENMIHLYARGAFPMADEQGSIHWYLPDVRTIIPLSKFNCPRSLRKFMRTSGFQYRFDTCFMEVIQACADREETWISPRLIEAYKGLYARGNLHTVEVWHEDRLVGGLYGVTFHGAFFGESMFSRVPQASKAALVKLVERLNERGFAVLDVQYQTPHLQMFGATEIPYKTFNKMLLEAYKRDCIF